MPFDTTLSLVPAAGTIRAIAKQTDRLSLIGIDTDVTRKQRETNGPRVRRWILHKDPATGRHVNQDGRTVDLNPVGFPSGAGGNWDPDPEDDAEIPAEREPRLDRDDARALASLRDDAADWRNARVAHAGRILALHGKPTKPWPVGGVEGAEVVQPGPNRRTPDPKGDNGQWVRLAGHDLVADLPYFAALSGTPSWFTLDALLLATEDKWSAVRLAKVCGKSDRAVSPVVRAALQRHLGAQDDLAAGNQNVRAAIEEIGRHDKDWRDAFRHEFNAHIVWFGSTGARDALTADTANPGKLACPIFRAVLASRSRHRAKARAAWISTGTEKARALREMDTSCVVGAKAFGPHPAGSPSRHCTSDQDYAPPMTLPMVGGIGSESGVREFGAAAKSLTASKYRASGRLLTACEVAVRLAKPPSVPYRWTKRA